MTHVKHRFSTLSWPRRRFIGGLMLVLLVLAVGVAFFKPPFESCQSTQGLSFRPSLEEMKASSSVIILGTIERSNKGNVYDYHVRVDKVVKGRRYVRPGSIIHLCSYEGIAAGPFLRSSSVLAFLAGYDYNKRVWVGASPTSAVGLDKETQTFILPLEDGGILEVNPSLDNFPR